MTGTGVLWYHNLNCLTRKRKRPHRDGLRGRFLIVNHRHVFMPLLWSEAVHKYRCYDTIKCLGICSCFSFTISIFLFLVIWKQVVASLSLRYDRATEFAFKLVTGCFCHTTTFLSHFGLLFVALGIALLRKLCSRSFCQYIKGYFQIGHVVSQVFLLQSLEMLVLLSGSRYGRSESGPGRCRECGVCGGSGA